MFFFFFFLEVEKTCSSNPNELLLYPAKDQGAPCSPPPLANSNASPTPSHTPPDQPPPSPAQPRPTSTHLSRSGSGSPQSPPSSPSSSSSSSSPPTLSPELRQKLEELLGKYSSGLWAHALPKLFQDAYKVSKTLTDRRSLVTFTP